MKRAIQYVALAGAAGSLIYAAIFLRGGITQAPSGAWIPAGNMVQARSGASAVLLSDGRALITGGDSGTGPLASVEIFGTDGMFSSAPSMTFVRSQHAAVKLQDGRVLALGGIGADGRSTDTAEIFDPTTNAWSTAGPLMAPRSGHTATLLQNGRVLVAGGVSSGAATNTVEIFDPASAAFTLVTGVLSSAKAAHAGILLQDGRVLIVGGSDGTNALASSDLYDPATGVVGPGPALSTPRQGLSATTLHDGKVLVAGGNNGAKDLASAEVYDPATGTFLPVPGALATPRSGHLAFLMPHNNGVLIVGGTSSGVALSSAEVYMPWTGAFSSMGSLAAARATSTGSGLSRDGLFLIAGGKDASGAALSNAELYGFVTIKTDKDAYAPGDTVTIAGGGWKPGETITLVLHEVPTLHPDRALKATADASGNVFDKSFSPEAHSTGVTFYLTAVGSSWQAQTTFLDLISTTTSLVSDPNPSVYGQPVLLTATVTASSGSATPTGTVQFKVDGAAFGSPVPVSACGPLGSACASISAFPLATGSRAVDADYSGDSNFLPSSGSLSGGQTVNKASLTIALVNPDNNPSVSGEFVTFTATLTPVPPGDGFPTGTVTFKDAGVAIGTGMLTDAGWATFTTSTLSLGAHSITAVYNGDSNFLGNTSDVLTQSVNQASTTTALVSSGNPSVFGQALTFTATVSALPPGNGTPTGTVTFKDGATTLGVRTLAGGWTILNISTLSIGAHSITAVYSGDSNFLGNTSDVFTQTVNQGSTSTALVSSGNPSVFGQSVTFTATVSVAPPGDGALTGSVSFKDGAVIIGTGNLTSGRWTTFSISTLTVGIHSITAVYNGDSSFPPSTSAALGQAVNSVSTTTTVVSSVNPSLFGQSVTFTATVGAVGPGGGTPSGTVNFRDGGITIGSGTLASGGWTTLTTSTLSVGPHSITAVYNGDGNFLGSTSATFTQTVNQASTTTVLVSSLNPSMFGESVTFTATVRAVPPGSGTATGMVSFLDGGTSIGTGTLTPGGWTILNTFALSVGSHSITAVYRGDSNFLTSTSPALVQTVN